MLFVIAILSVGLMPVFIGVMSVFTDFFSVSIIALAVLSVNLGSHENDTWDPLWSFISQGRTRTDRQFRVACVNFGQKEFLGGMKPFYEKEFEQNRLRETSFEKIRAEAKRLWPENVANPWWMLWDNWTRLIQEAEYWIKICRDEGVSACVLVVQNEPPKTGKPQATTYL